MCDVKSASFFSRVGVWAEGYDAADAENTSHDDARPLSWSQQLLISILTSLFLARLLHNIGYF